MILGLTGAIGSGKSAVLKAFGSRNWSVSDADKLCHNVYDLASEELLDALKKDISPECVNADNSVNRKKIAAAVFGNPAKLDLLNKLIIPEFEKEFFKFLESNKNKNAICEIPLLFEKGYQKYFDAVVAVWTPEKLRIERLKSMRFMSDSEISEREKLQYSATQKAELADYCLINDGTLETLGRQIDILIEYIK